MYSRNQNRENNEEFFAIGREPNPAFNQLLIELIKKETMIDQ
jgi:hypothetical protein